MASIVFWIFTVLALLGGLGVIFFKQPIKNVLSLVGVMISLAVLFLLLSAQFVFVVQVIVYAGAVMVLFLFVIALLGPIHEEGTHRLPWLALVATIVVAAFAGFLYAMLRSLTYRTPDSGVDLNFFGTVESIGAGLFTRYLFPFELTSVLLLVAAIGAIYLSRRTPDEPPEAGEPEPLPEPLPR